MDKSELRLARRNFNSHKGTAKNRGISFQFTFDEWIEWWGDDLWRRGIGPNDLQMQRIGDAGPYKAGNARKGTPKSNGQTRREVGRLKRSFVPRELDEIVERAESDADVRRFIGRVANTVAGQ